jgi:putative phosphoribosyl transferase
MAARYHDRTDAGRVLATQLSEYAHRPDVIVLALPRGGVPVAYEVARALGAPLDVFVVRKLGLPAHPEFAIGAIASGGVRVLDQGVIRQFGVSMEELAAVTAAEQRELERRERRYRENRPFPDVRNKTVILVDDGLATGATMAAAAAALRAEEPAKLVAAVPVAAPATCDSFRGLVDDIVCAATPEPFRAVGLWYEDFSQTSDETVHDLLARAANEHPQGPPEPAAPSARIEREVVTDGHTMERVVRVTAGQVVLEGTLAEPENARGVILFAHGSGSSRHSPRNRYVARELQRGGLATLLIDLLTSGEEAVDVTTRRLRFDIGLLADRLVGAIDWLTARPETGRLAIGLFGASTGAGAALVAAAERPRVVRGVVSRGGRPDLAGAALPHVRAPTLLVVGGDDERVIRLNELAMAHMRAPVELKVIPGASHLFEETGTLEEVARLARNWFQQHLVPARARGAAAGDERITGRDISDRGDRSERRPEAR